ncbi:MAG: hypothetical protein LBT40_15285, partial [Deltaproteobacteria bacterium]|nr:hypothetical protein [Deltaproteobacteria bacterium]
LDSLEEVSPATPTVNRSEEEPGVMGGIEMFVRWWYLNGYHLLMGMTGMPGPGARLEISRNQSVPPVPSDRRVRPQTYALADWFPRFSRKSYALRQEP